MYPASPLEGLAGLGLQLTREPDGTLLIRRVELEPRERRQTSLWFTLIWNAVVLVVGAFLFLPIPGEVTTSFSNVGKWIVGFFGLLGLSMLYHLIWTRLGREVWLVGRNRLEVRQTLLGIPRRRKYAGAEVVLRRFVENTWFLDAGSKPQRLMMVELEPAQLPALFDLAELLARETGWTVRAPERPDKKSLAPASAVCTAPDTVPGPAKPLAIDPALRRLFELDLDPDERLFWTGRPDAKRAARLARPLLFVGIPWTLIAARFCFPWSEESLFPGVFMVLGLAMCGAPWYAYRRALRTRYAVTGQRVLILTEGSARKLEQYGRAELCDPERQELADGSGDLVIARRQEKDSEGGTRTVDVKLIGIPQVRAVERLLRQLFR